MLPLKLTLEGKTSGSLHLKIGVDADATPNRIYPPEMLVKEETPNEPLSLFFSNRKLSSMLSGPLNLPLPRRGWYKSWLHPVDLDATQGEYLVNQGFP